MPEIVGHTCLRNDLYLTPDKEMRAGFAVKCEKCGKVVLEPKELIRKRE